MDILALLAKSKLFNICYSTSNMKLPCVGVCAFLPIAKIPKLGGEERRRSGGLLWVTATDPCLLAVAPSAYPSVSRWMGNHTRRCSWIKRSSKKEGSTLRYVNKTVWEVKKRSTEFSLAQTGASGVHTWTLTPFIGLFFEAGSPRKTNRIVPIALKSLTIKQIQNDSWVRFCKGKRAH